MDTGSTLPTLMCYSHRAAAATTLLCFTIRKATTFSIRLKPRRVYSERMDRECGWGDTYETVHVVSSHGGEDRATLHGTAGADQFVSRPQDHLAIFRNDIETHVIGFAQSKALANDEADRALFYDTSARTPSLGVLN